MRPVGFAAVQMSLDEIVSHGKAMDCRQVEGFGQPQRNERSPAFSEVTCHLHEKIHRRRIAGVQHGLPILGNRVLGVILRQGFTSEIEPCPPTIRECSDASPGVSLSVEATLLTSERGVHRIGERPIKVARSKMPRGRALGLGQSHWGPVFVAIVARRNLVAAVIRACCDFGTRGDGGSCAVRICLCCTQQVFGFDF